MDEKTEIFVAEKLRLMKERCRIHKLSLTAQRRAILENLASRKDHPTADQIYGAIQGRVNGLSRTTVYRVLETFVQLGLASKICSPEAKSRFEADTKRHHHAVCNHCEAVVDIYSDSLDNIDIPVDGTCFDIHDFSVSFTGLCSNCRDTVKRVHISDKGEA